eukprot:2225398-Ditylum_brightwellii.AAC.1
MEPGKRDDEVLHQGWHGTMIHGGGAKETATTLGFLDLPGAAAMEQKGFQTVEQEIEKVLRDLALR